MQRELFAQPGLADAGLARHEDEAAVAAVDLGEATDEARPLVLPTDERGATRFVGAHGRGRGRARRGLPAEVRILGKDALFELPQPGTGFDAQILDEHIARVLERAQSVCLASGAVQRKHQQLAEALADGVLLREPLGLDRDRRVPPAFQVDRELGLERDEVQLHEPLALRLRPLLVGDVGEGRAPPQRGTSARKIAASSSRARSTASRADVTLRSKRTASTCSGAMSST